MQNIVSIERELNYPAHLIWPYLSDTATMNKKLKLSPMTFNTVGNIRHGQQKILFFKLNWTEKPWEWVYGEWLENERLYSKGFFKRLRTRFEINSLGSSSIIKLQFKIDHRFPIFANFLNKQTLIIAEKIIHYIESSLKVSSSFNRPVLQESFDQWISSAHEVDRARIQPKKVAKELGTDWQNVVHDSRSKHWQSRFSLLFDATCPHCQGAIESAPRLTELPKKIKCESCSVDFDLTKKENLSITLRDSSLPSHLKGVDFCSSDVSHKPHVIMQRLGNDWKESLELEPGLYYLKRNGFIDGQLIHISKDAPKSVFRFKQDWDNSNEHPYLSGPSLTIHSEGLSIDEVCFLEYKSHHESNLTVAEAILDPKISKLIPKECLTSDFPIEVGNKTLLFTDVVGSTDLYFLEGDANAFNKIRASFLHIGAVCSKYNSTLVKTIGDASMYAFASPEDAIHASIELQRDNPSNYLPLRISLHHGECLSISTKDGQDFFGDTVNICAKFQSQAEGHEIVFEESLLSDNIIDSIQNIKSERLIFDLSGKTNRSFKLIKLVVE